MVNKLLLTIPVVFLPSAAVAQGADASSVLGRDVAPQTPRTGERAKRAPIINRAPVEAVSANAEGEVQIGAVRVEGLSELSQADFADIAENYAGRTVDNAGLQALARAVADRARERGYIFASAAVPPQQLNIGIVRVVLDEGTVDEVRIAGSTNGRLKALLDPIVGKSVRKEDVESPLLLATDIPGVTVLDTRFVREGERGVLIVQAKDVPTRGSVALDNWGPAAFGAVRARLEFEIAGLIDDDDQLNTYTTLTPLQPRELTYISARYANTISADGLQFAVTGGAGRTHEANRTFGFEANGRSRYAAASLISPVKRESNASLWVSGEFAWQQITQDFVGLFRQRDQLATVTLSGWGNARLGAGRLYGGVSMTRGLGILGATEANDAAISRADGSGEFTKGNAWVNWVGTLKGSLSMRLAANGQLASRPLLSSQEIGLGGPFFGRGYDFSERFGDQGVLGLAELRRNFERPTKWLDWAHVYGFVDGGYVDNLRGGFGGGTLVSGGGGIRAGRGRAEIGFEVAAPINADRFESGDKSPKVNLVVSYGF